MQLYSLHENISSCKKKLIYPLSGTISSEAGNWYLCIVYGYPQRQPLLHGSTCHTDKHNDPVPIQSMV